ncbi:MAG: hypothetical protein M2R45_05499 [Verrucomicrobia subdivision 3 bacterium]|nr:hypothetical protein [Limisphaerales bacterium]MCS1412298.1 hypothetical protein [Limisphaerales bacterium]
MKARYWSGGSCDSISKRGHGRRQLDYREDGVLAIGIGNFANEMTALYVEQDRAMIFVDEAVPAGIGSASRQLLTFGLFFFDYDLDGWQDLLTANGHLEEEIFRVQKSRRYEQPAQLFWHSGPEHGCRFYEVGVEQSGGDLWEPIVGRGSAFADIACILFLLCLAGSRFFLR